MIYLCVFCAQIKRMRLSSTARNTAYVRISVTFKWRRQSLQTIVWHKMPQH